MKNAKLILVMCILLMVMILGACNKDGELDLKGIVATDTPAPTEAEATPSPTATAEPTKEITPTAVPTEVPTAVPTEEPTPEPTAEPTATPEPTVAITVFPSKEPFVLTYDAEDMEVEKPEPLIIGLNEISESVMSEDGQNKLAFVSYDKIVLPDDVAEEYPNLALAVEVKNMENRDMIETAFEEYNDYISSGNILEGAFYSLDDRYDILRADSKVVSLVNENSGYTGGVRPYTGIAGFSIDTETGEILKIDQVCHDLDSLGTMIAYRLAEKYDEFIEDIDIEDVIERINAEVVLGDIKFALGYEGVTFYFPEYDLAPINLSVSIPYDESIIAETEDGTKMIGLFAKIYRTVPDNYMQTLHFEDEIELLDIDEEKSEFSTFSIYCSPSAEYPDESSGFSIYINGYEKLRMDNTYFYGDELNLISVDGKKFIMIKTVQASEDITTYIYRIFENGEIGYDTGDIDIDDYFGIELTALKDVYGEGQWDFDYTDNVVYDPMNASVSFRHDVLGTNFVKAFVRFNTDDVGFDLNDPFYEFTYRTVLTLKKDFKAGMIDPELMFNGDDSVTGEMDMEVELTAGDIIYLEKCRYTGQDQVFFSTDSGEWGTFLMDTDSFMTINGEDAFEIFDGILLAD